MILDTAQSVVGGFLNFLNLDLGLILFSKIFFDVNFDPLK